MRASLPLTVMFLVAACARSEDASLVKDVNQQLVEQVRTPEQDDGGTALGEWNASPQGGQSALEFGPVGAQPVFSINCDARRTVHLQRHRAALTGDLPTMLVSIGSETRRLALTSVSGTVPMLRGSLAPSDPFVGILARANGVITVRIGDSPPLLLPPNPAIGAFLERCTSGASTPTGDDSVVDANQAEPASIAPANVIVPTR